jgi:acyl carrier protein
MTKSEFYRGLEEIVEVDEGTITGSETLDALGGWDSLAVVSFIAFADESLNAPISGSQLRECKTVQDLLSLVRDKITN